MSKFIGETRDKYLNRREAIYKTQYEKAKQEISEEEFKKDYSSETAYGAEAYYKITRPDIKDEELPLYFQTKIYDQLQELNKHTKVIKGIAIFFAALSAVSLILAIIQMASIA